VTVAWSPLTVWIGWLLLGTLSCEMRHMTASTPAPPASVAVTSMVTGSACQPAGAVTVVSVGRVESVPAMTTVSVRHAVSLPALSATRVLSVCVPRPLIVTVSPDACCSIAPPSTCQSTRAMPESASVPVTATE
jgi:hypothetical protein